METRTVVIFISLLIFGGDCLAAEPWWRTYTPFVTAHGDLAEATRIHGDAIRGVGYFGGWYGFWYLDAQEEAGWSAKSWEAAKHSGMRRIFYYDLGEIGDYAGFFTANGVMKYNGWSLPQFKGDEPLTARWFGLDAFMRNVPWASYPTAKSYNLPPFTTPDGKPADDLYEVLTQRGLDGKWSFDYSSNPSITGDIAARSGLSGISGKQAHRAEIHGKTGWQTVRLVNVDFSNPQLRDYCCREIERIIPKIHPDGIHADNFGDATLGNPKVSAFGMWSVHSFRDYLSRHFAPAELERMGVTDVNTFDIAAYVKSKPRDAKSHEWTTDPVWLCYMIHLVEASQEYHRAFYAAAKKSAAQAGYDCAVFGNTIPFPLAGSLLKGACDVAHFEWSTEKSWWGMKPMGLPPNGRLGYVARLGTAISDAPFCWPSLYLSKDKSGKGHENLHKALAFDGLGNHALLDFGHWFLDGYSPGTAESADFINRFIQANKAPLSQRRYLADVAVIYSPWSGIASCTLLSPALDMFADEYAGWCQFLGDTHRQWDVVLQQDLTAKNLARFPVIVLPSAIVLTDAQAAELQLYAESGGHIVATGSTGTRRGPEDHLAARTTAALASLARRPNVHIVTDKPGVAYWRHDADPRAAHQMTELLEWPTYHPRLETNAPNTTGVNLNISTGEIEFLTLDLNNCALEADTDTLHEAPAAETKIRLPESWRNRHLHISYVTPEMKSESSPTEMGADIRVKFFDSLVRLFDAKGVADVAGDEPVFVVVIDAADTEGFGGLVEFEEFHGLWVIWVGWI